MPHRVNQWNYTNRGSATCHNDVYRGKSNGSYQASTMKSNQGFASVIATFPQGSFATCRYPDSAAAQRTPEQNNWHPQFPGVGYVPSAASAIPHNTTGTNPLPIPFNERPGYEEEEAKAAAAAHEKYLAFKNLQLSNEGGDIIPPDFHEHTIYSATHVATEPQVGVIFRPSKARVGTTPAERAAAMQKLVNEQTASAAADASATAQLRRQQQQRAEDEYQYRTVDPCVRSTTGYNIPLRPFQAQQQQQQRY